MLIFALFLHFYTSYTKNKNKQFNFYSNMKCTIPEISWHNREPVLSVDIFPISHDFYRLASGGGDCHVLIWQMNLSENGAVKQEVISDLTRHQRAVNCVRWSPSGQYLATGDDDANIIIWQLKTDNIPLLEGETGDKEIWIPYKVFRGHKEDVYDLCWSVDSLKLFSGSVDNTAILWELEKGKMEHILTDHKGFVQGVAWDPKNQIIATISTDRICRIFDTSGKHVKARIFKGNIMVPEDHYLFGKEVKYFHDDTFKSFFRRLQFTPDGSLLIVPSGHMETDNCKKILNGTLMFALDQLNMPVAILPLTRQSSTVVRCCPILFELQEDGPEPFVNLPYRMIFAIGTDHDIILYDTQQKTPFARFQDIHYTRLTDLTWSNDGLLLVASSTDGFCALITFDPQELGLPYVKEESDTEENVLNISGCEELENKDENIDINNKEKIETDVKSKKRSSFLEQWALNTPKRIKLEKEENTKVNEIDGVIEILDEEESKPKEVINQLIPKRVAPVRIDEAKPIEVRRKPKEMEDKKEAKPNHFDAKPIAVRRRPQQEEKKQKDVENATKPDNSNAKPIAIRKKPKLEEKNKDDVQKCSKPDHSDANPIAVRRKPKQTDNLKANQNRIVETEEKGEHHVLIIEANGQERSAEPIKGVNENESAESKHETVQKSKENGTETDNKKQDHTRTQTTASQKKTKESEQKSNQKNADSNNGKEVISDGQEKNEECDKTEEKVKGEKRGNLKKEKSAKRESEGKKQISKKDTNDETIKRKNDDQTPTKEVSTKNKQKKRKSLEEKNKDIPPKIKMSSLVKKKPKEPETPPSARKNPLLSFLRKSSEKNTKANVKKKEPEVLESVDLTLDDEARDAWKCEKIKHLKPSDSKSSSDIKFEEDDCTEDFTLQLEDSQTETDVMEIDGTSENQEMNDKTEIKEKVPDDSNNAEKEKSLKLDNVQKVPRRVNLITLASPKGKSKMKDKS